MRMPDTLQVLDICRTPVAAWLVMRADDALEPSYWGGPEGPENQAALPDEMMPGPQYWSTLSNMLNMIGKLGSRPLTESYAICRAGYGYPLDIRRDMDAAALAAVLDCTTEQVVNHYRLLVRVAELDDDPPPADSAEAPPVPPDAAADQAGTVPAAAAPEGGPA